MNIGENDGRAAKPFDQRPIRKTLMSTAPEPISGTWEQQSLTDEPGVELRTHERFHDRPRYLANPEMIFC